MTSEHDREFPSAPSAQAPEMRATRRRVERSAEGDSLAVWLDVAGLGSVWALAAALVGAAGCGTSAEGESQPHQSGYSVATRAPATLEESEAASARVADLRARFQVAVPDLAWDPARAGSVTTSMRSAIGERVASGFERAPSGRLRALMPPDTARRVPRPASVELPTRADGAAWLEDDTTKVAISFALDGAIEAPVAVADGIAVYSRAIGGADVVHRVHAEGTEDFVVFEERPTREELRYVVDVSRVAGLRLVSNTLEFLDEGGAPRLRVAPPYVVDASGERHEARIAVEGCGYDDSPAPPWSRSVTAPGADRCAVRVTWRGVSYPAIVDPAWIATGSMASARGSTANLLPNGKVLMGGPPSPAELYDPTTGTFAVTGAPLEPTRGGATYTTLASGKVLVACGIVGGSTYGTSAELYDPVTGTFTPTGPTVSPRLAHTATLLPSGKVLLTGGQTGGFTFTSSAELYDPISGSFAATGSMAQELLGHSAAAISGSRVLVAGGRSQPATTGLIVRTSQLYDAASGTFSPTGSMTTERAGHVAIPLLDGKVLVAGGFFSEPLSTAELYDPAQAMFTGTGAMSVARTSMDAVLLPNGKVLIAGGLSPPSPTSELYDPATGAFVSAGMMTTPRRSAPLVVLPSGAALIAGGLDTVSTYTKSAELFAVVAAGGSCAVGGECVSGFCNSGVCCTAACGSTTCTRCTATTGACVSVTSADDPDTCTGNNTCDAAGACKLKTTQPCPGGASTCANGQCVDGFCCNTQCSGSCDACAASLGASSNGTCTPVAAGSTGTPTCAPYRCDGAAGACPTTCDADTDCAAAAYCAADGTCQARKAQGAACNLAAAADCEVAGCRACQSTFCVDGFCCNNACAAPAHFCQACAAALKESGVNGTCGPAKNYTNPHNDACAKDAYPSCGRDGNCNGSGACQVFAANGVDCGDTTCMNGIESGPECNGAGVCLPAGSPDDCAPFLCQDGFQCRTTCTTAAHCATTAFCNAATSLCEGLLVDGEPCTDWFQCQSSNCADGVCCNQTCGGQCEACDLPGLAGRCGPVTGPPAGNRPDCPGSGPCQGQCHPSNRDACTYPAAGNECIAATCQNDSRLAPAVCDGAGVCGTQALSDCGEYTCDTTTSACKTSCTTNADCRQGGVCDTSSGTGTCSSGMSTCEGGYSVRAPDGTITSCDGHRCVAGACQQQCGGASDCAPGYVCTASACVLEADGGAGGFGAGGEAGASGSGAAGGAGGDGASTGGASAGDGGSGAPSAGSGSGDEGGCGCRAASARTDSRVGVFLAAGLVLAIGRRRSRRRVVW